MTKTWQCFVHACVCYNPVEITFVLYIYWNTQVSITHVLSLTTFCLAISTGSTFLSPLKPAALHSNRSWQQGYPKRNLNKAAFDWNLDDATSWRILLPVRICYYTGIYTHCMNLNMCTHSLLMTDCSLRTSTNAYRSKTIETFSKCWLPWNHFWRHSCKKSLFLSILWFFPLIQGVC